MKNRFSKVSRGKAWILILLAVSGVTSSCKDEYLLDDEKPPQLSSSIYGMLQKGQYSNYIRLLSDPDVNNAEDADNNRGWVDVLSKTGSKTVFVANDSAWAKFFRNNAQLDKSNPWSNATSYENLSAAQKKLLIHTSMLNNAMVMENLSSNGVSSSSRGMLLRRNTDVETTDTITHLEGDDLPRNYNRNNQETDYWDRFRAENGGKGLYLVTDSTPSMMIHFTNEYLTRNRITNEDFEIISNQTRTTNDVHINGHRLMEQDGVCENGYVNTTDGVMMPLASMAEVLRTNGKTRIFSHMIDRWSAPFYSPTITRAYQGIMAAKGIEWKDSIFVKRYFSERSFGGKALNRDPEGLAFNDSLADDATLKFDPAWNAYYPESPTPNPGGNMAAMYVPTDDVLWEYFQKNGGGWQLIQTFCNPDVTYSPAHTEEDYLKLFDNIDQIPRSTLRSLINVIMFPNFAESVPSKMTKLRDDANEQLFYDDDINHIVGSLLASNGVIYLTDRVYGPADYTSVTAPAYISDDKQVMRWAIYYGSVDDNTNFPLHINYYAYLKAMKSRFAFFMPDDEAMKYYYDPMSFTSLQKRVIELSRKKKDDNKLPINAKMFSYNPETGVIGRVISSSISDDEICNRLKDLLETHTIVLEGEMEEIDSDVDEYYISKIGSPVRVKRNANGEITSVQGGFQIENEKKGLESTTNGLGVIENKVKDLHKQLNGRTYILDSPIVSTPRSVYSILTNNDNLEESDYKEFYQLCGSGENTTIDKMDIIHACGLVDDEATQEDQLVEERKYEIFTSQSPEGNYAVDYNVSFFNNYRYTIFVPTNEAVRKAINEHNLPTWDSIEEFYKSKLDEETGQLTSHSDSLALQAMITCLTNFVRYHFLDNSVFVDKSNIAENERVTACFNSDKGLFNKVMIKRENQELQVKDTNGGEYMTVEGNYNVLARDIFCNGEVKNNNMLDKTIMTSSFAVIHQIPHVLNHVEVKDGDFANLWAKDSECRKYLKRYAIK